MLCDKLADIGVDPLLYPPQQMAPFIEQINNSHKFVLAAEFAQVADQLRDDMEQIAKALPLCRLPFQSTWIELAHAHRELHSAVPLKVWERKIKRVGFLLSSTSKRLTAFKAHMFWELDLPRLPQAALQAGAWAIRFDLESDDAAKHRIARPDDSPEWNRLSSEAKTQMLRTHRVDTPEYGIPPLWNELDEQMLDNAMQMTLADWAGEVQFVLAVLALLNTRNVAQTEFVDRTRMNKQRLRRKERPMQSHYMLKIAPRVMQRVRDARGDQHEHVALRQHFVRGHWKTRKTGVYFWKPFMRGDPTVGEITKRYEIA